MAATLSNEQFLFSCIEYSNNGTINWDAVAQACGITTKGAAAMKYRRLKDRFGTIAGGRGSGDGTAGRGTPKKGPKTPRKQPEKGRKKRKVDDADDEEETEQKIESEEEKVKEESVEG